MLSIRGYRFGAPAQVSICCGLSLSREYLWNRCVAEMEAEFRGLPVEIVAGVLEDEEWNESRCKNCAANVATAPVLLFTNCDIVIPAKVCEVVVRVPEHQMFVFHREDEQPDGSWVWNQHAIGDCQAVRRELWVKANGFDERLTGWGYIDYSFAKRCHDVGAEVIALGNATVQHRWHPRLSDEEYRRQNQRNRELSGV